MMTSCSSSVPGGARTGHREQARRAPGRGRREKSRRSRTRQQQRRRGGGGGRGGGRRRLDVACGRASLPAAAPSTDTVRPSYILHNHYNICPLEETAFVPFVERALLPGGWPPASLHVWTRRSLRRPLLVFSLRARAAGGGRRGCGG